MTQISNMQVIGFMVDFKKLSNLWSANKTIAKMTAIIIM